MAPDEIPGIVLDTSLLVAYHNEHDLQHARALEAMEDVIPGTWGTALLPEYVFLELTTVLARRRDVATASSAGEWLLGATELEFVPCSGLFFDVFDAFRAMRGSNPSFTDAAIVVIARGRGIDRVGTFDRDFLQVEGIRVVPAPE